jgi:hypothetical protein
LEDKFTGANVTNKVLEAKQLKILGTTDDDVAVG